MMKNKLYSLRWDLVMWECDIQSPSVCRTRVILKAGEMVLFYEKFKQNHILATIVFFHLKSATWLNMNTSQAAHLESFLAFCGLAEIDRVKNHV